MLILLIHLQVDKARNFDNGFFEPFELLPSGHDASEVRMIGEIDDATVMKLPFCLTCPSFTELVGDLDTRRHSGWQGIIIIGRIEQHERPFGVFSREVGAIEKDTEEPGVLLDGYQ